MAIPMKNYVKFLRGTPTAWEKLQNKDPDTLYFISKSDEEEGILYFGDKLIAGGGSNPNLSLEDLQDVLISEGVKTNSALVFNGMEWVDKPLNEILISVFKGATATKSGVAGLVPAPAAGQQNLFLKGDGTWAAATVEELQHSLYIGDKVFNGSSDITIEVYDGSVDDEDVNIQTFSMSSNMQLNETLMTMEINNYQVNNMEVQETREFGNMTIATSNLTLLE